jgi:VanZ family protein
MQERIARYAGWGLAIAIIVASVVPADLRLQTGAPHNLEHFVIYAVTGVAFGLGYAGKRPAVGLLLVLFAGSTEFVQLFVPGRHARAVDFIVDALASCVGVLTVSLISHLHTAATRTTHFPR